MKLFRSLSQRRNYHKDKKSKKMKEKNKVKKDPKRTTFRDDVVLCVRK